MPIFIRNFALEHLVQDDQLDSQTMLDLYNDARWRHAHGAMYMVKELDNHLQFIFRAIREGDEVKILGTDTHYKGECIWNTVPFFNASSEDTDVLSAIVALTNKDQDAVCVAHMMNAAVLPELEQGTTVEMQVAAFPLLIESYKTRAKFEESFSKEDVESPWPVLITDQRILPLNFMLANDPEIPEEQRIETKSTDVMLLASSVLDVKRVEGMKEGTHFNVATVKCEFGHLDLVYSDSMVSEPIVKGSYIVCSAIISADVALGEYTNWVE
ncbi:MAG: hypothetical protein PQJ47_09735 [Sphaerochaetaceae bacterium]|nr:hypothetical protein [Sphaerochaetaceae bacterium]MDC7247092.1 hypothetical protein [Sphaerochaetaceae bacterium]